MTETKPLEGQTALVTGASRGIGAATAIALAEAGAHVILTARKVKALEAVEDRIHAAGGTSTIAPLDLTEGDAVARLASAIAGRWDTLDILVLSAAYLPELTPLSQIDPKQFNQALMTNVVATQALLAGFDPLLRRAKNGRVIGLTSSVGAAPRSFWSAYGSTKAAFDNLLETYAAEVEKLSPLRVAIIDPGATRTEMRARAYPGEDPETVKPPEAVAERIVALLQEDFATGHRERVEG
ncbi:SDR family NAD(P)-dependent oxidoreductase [Erythrobacter sp. GH1-10]|uniref:SDR family NAD(P)-dependent oxidoreductase n=1 Tax=Erythrobacter sp. GH1-10 TaxID=3349334 RepID=UPI00387841D9